VDIFRHLLRVLSLDDLLLALVRCIEVVYVTEESIIELHEATPVLMHQLISSLWSTEERSVESTIGRCFDPRNIKVSSDNGLVNHPDLASIRWEVFGHFVDLSHPVLSLVRCWRHMVEAGHVPSLADVVLLNLLALALVQSGYVDSKAC